MNKLQELLELDWAVSAIYTDMFYLVAEKYLDTDSIIKTAAHQDLEMAVTKLYYKCKAVKNDV